MGRLWKKITDHPFISGTFTLLGLVAAYFPLFTDKKIPAFLADKWWVLAMAPWYYLFVGAIGCTAVVLYFVLIREVRATRRALAWLEQIADEDSQDMTHRVHLDNRDIHAQLPAHLEAAEPYIDLSVHVCNFSVYTLSLSHMTGKFAFQGNLLHYPPEILSPHDKLPHAVPVLLTLRQRFLPTTAQLIMREGKLHLETGKAALHFTYQDRSGKTQQVRIAFGNLLISPLS